jgi:hypothetical protein
MKRGVSRRTMVLAGAAVSALPLVHGRAFAATQPLVRYDVATPQGAAQLKKFARAVKLMSARAVGDPTSWTFQWFTHYVRDDSKKDTELAKLPPESRVLAAELWNTCQAHGSNNLEDCFLPWHRIYLYYFERIVRAVLNDGSFTMPYWNYTDPASRVLPRAFRFPTNSSNPLYRKHRKAQVNQGHALDDGQGTPSLLNLACLDQQNYRASDGTTQGFCLNLDSGLHASVHVLIGDSQGMGDIKWAASDPIFWLHHANVDRLWASWLAGGHSNPDDDAWRNHEFAFADEKGRRVAARVGDFADLAALGYRYDRLEPVPFAIAQAPVKSSSAPSRAPPPGTVGAAAPPPAFENATPAAAPSPSNMVASAAGPVAIGTVPVQIALNLPPQVLAAPGAVATGAPPPEKAAPPTAGARPQAPPTAAAPPPAAPTHLYLVIRNLQARAQPGVLYAVYLNVGTGAAKKSSRLGTISFFDAGMAGMMSQKFASFDVTGIVDGNISTIEVAVTVAPVGEPARDAKPVIGDITLASG